MKPTLAVFIHDPQCETECALGMIDGLVRDFNIRTFGIDELYPEFLDTVDAVAFPGGMGDADDFYEIFTHEDIKAVQNFVANGGKYFGICMGAYWASQHYFDVANNLEIAQYIEQPGADIDYEGATIAEVTWNGSSEWMYFYDGCAIDGNNMNVVATYANGHAMAVIQGNVGIIGCHPEAQDWWYTLDGMSKSYYNVKHKKLMAEFVKELVNNE